MMCNLDSESVAIERIREYDNLPQVNIIIIMVNIIIITMVVSNITVFVICRKLLGRHRQSLALHWTGQTGARFSSSTSLPSSFQCSDNGHNQILVENVTASHAANLPPALCNLSLSISGGEKVTIAVISAISIILYLTIH